MMNSIGPDTDPWGTPLETIRGEEATHCVLLILICVREHLVPVKIKLPLKWQWQCHAAYWNQTGDLNT